MLITKEVEVRWSGNNKQWYESKGYKCVKCKDKLIVSINDLLKTSSVKIEYQCDECGEIKQTCYRDYVKSQDDLCKRCSVLIKVAGKLRMPFSNVEILFKTKGYILLSTESEFKNNKSKLRYLCDKHGEQSISYNHLQKGKGCPMCANDKHRLPFNVIEDAFNHKGYVLISTVDDYINCQSKLHYICKDHGEQSTTYSSIKQSKGCPICADEKYSKMFSGENCIQWNKGVTELNKYLRIKLTNWSQQQLQRTNYTCELTGEKGQGNLNVHHMYGFSNIRDLTLSQLNLPIYQTIGEYGDKLQLLTDTFLENNEIHAKPIVMLESVHKAFHSFCGGYSKETSLDSLELFKETLQTNYLVTA